MKSNIKKKLIKAVETYAPQLSVEYKDRFDNLVIRLGLSLPLNRNRIIDDEIDSLDIGIIDECNDIDRLKYAVSLSVLKDLSQQGWCFQTEGAELRLRMDEDDLDDKAHIRYRLSAERNAQFKIDSIRKFILKMEKPRLFQNEMVSVKNLIGDKHELIQKIKRGNKVCQPYVQLVSHEKDVYTGIELSDIWRYFRYTWSIPYKTMPGRNLFYFVRDAGQKYHPIIGIFALGNSVLNLTVRDDDIGWTLDSIKKNMQQQTSIMHCEQVVSGTEGKTIKTRITKSNETDQEFKKRTEEYADKMLPLLVKNITSAINDIYTKDLKYYRQTKYLKQEYIDRLLEIAIEQNALSINNKNNEKNPDWVEETLGYVTTNS